jgi:hypothetical protein
MMQSMIDGVKGRGAVNARRGAIIGYVVYHNKPGAR